MRRCNGHEATARTRAPRRDARADFVLVDWATDWYTHVPLRCSSFVSVSGKFLDTRPLEGDNTARRDDRVRCRPRRRARRAIARGSSRVLDRSQRHRIGGPIGLGATSRGTTRISTAASPTVDLGRTLSTFGLKRRAAPTATDASGTSGTIGRTSDEAHRRRICMHDRLRLRGRAHRRRPSRVPRRRNDRRMTRPSTCCHSVVLRRRRLARRVLPTGATATAALSRTGNYWLAGVVHEPRPA